MASDISSFSIESLDRNCLPLLREDKMQAIQEIARKHGSVAMGGDGVNDDGAFRGISDAVEGLAPGESWPPARD